MYYEHNKILALTSVSTMDGTRTFSGDTSCRFYDLIRMYKFYLKRFVVWYVLVIYYNTLFVSTSFSSFATLIS